MVFHQGHKVTKRGVSGEADLLLGVQGNQQGSHEGVLSSVKVTMRVSLAKQIFHHVLMVTKRVSLVRVVFHLGLKLTMRSVHHEGVFSLSFQGNNQDPEAQNIPEILHCCLSKALAVIRNTVKFVNI